MQSEVKERKIDKDGRSWSRDGSPSDLQKSLPLSRRQHRVYTAAAESANRGSIEAFSRSLSVTQDTGIGKLLWKLGVDVGPGIEFSEKPVALCGTIDGLLASAANLLASLVVCEPRNALGDEAEEAQGERDFAAIEAKGTEFHEALQAVVGDIVRQNLPLSIERSLKVEAQQDASPEAKDEA